MSAEGAPRPTIRCLREDLGFTKLPPATVPLHQIDHVLIGKAAEVGEVYVGIRIIGPAKPEIHAVILDAVPAVVDRNGWFLDSMPGRASRPGEIVWSNLLDADSLAELTDDHEGLKCRAIPVGP